MRGVWVGTTVFALSLAASSRAGSTVTFDFNTLSAFRGDLAISEYMSDVYGSPITTDGSRTVAEPDAEGDIFIATSIQFLGRGDFEILFEEQPIIGASFEGHVIDATIGDDFVFTAFFDDTEVFSLSRNDGEEVFPAEFITFDSPVNRLVISDSGRKDVGVDDLTVQPVPEPTSGVLAVTALGWLVSRRRRD